jgi:hypothetical protein
MLNPSIEFLKIPAIPQRDVKEKSAECKNDQTPVSSAVMGHKGYSAQKMG